MLMTIAEFSADFPDDAIMKGNDIAQPSGLNVMTALYDTLRAAGYQVDAPQMHDWYGWWFYVHTQGRRIWIMIQMIDDCVLQSQDMTPFWRRLSGKGGTAHGDLMTELEGLLARDSRFGERTWFADNKDYYARGRE